MAVSLHLASSPEATWENVVRRWFEKIAALGLRDQQPAAVVTASRSQAYFFRSCLLAEGKSLLGVTFLSPPLLREVLLRSHDPLVPLREHLRLFLSVTSEEFGDKNSDDETVLIAKSIARDPDSFLRAIDELRAAGWTLDEIDSPALREIAARFEEKVHECGFTFVHDADRIALAQARNLQPVFSNLLLFGFDSAHWPLWPLLEAGTLSSNEATVLLTDPRDDARDLDETWIGTWEEAFGPADVVPPSPAASRHPQSGQGEDGGEWRFESFTGPLQDEIHFIIGRDVTDQARAIVALAAKFLSDPHCERLGILFSARGALSRLVAAFLES